MLTGKYRLNAYSSTDETDQEISDGGEQSLSVMGVLRPPWEPMYLHYFWIVKILRENFTFLIFAGKCTCIYVGVYVNIKMILLCKCMKNNKTTWNCYKKKTYYYY